jgi:hypothetical protein
MADARAGARERADLGGGRVHHVREPHVLAHPSEALGVCDRCLAEGREAEPLLVERLGQVRMQAHAGVATREACALAHQVRRHAERRARSHPHAQHRARRGIVEHGKHALGVGEDRVLLLHEAVGRKAAAALAQAHRSARRVETHAQLARRFDIVVEARAVGKKIAMIGDGGGAGECQLREPELGAHPRGLRIDPSPDAVEHPQPVEEAKPASGTDRPRERLEEMVVAIHEPGHYHAAARIDRAHRGAARGLRRDPRLRLGRRADEGNGIALDRHAAAANLAPRAIHRHHEVGVANEERRHGSPAAMTPWRNPEWRR